MKYEREIPTKEQLQETVIEVVAGDQSKRNKIDHLLEIDANLYTQLGSQRTTEQVKEVKALSQILYRSIRSIDRETGELLLKNQDKR
jgi:hypothetical protein